MRLLPSWAGIVVRFIGVINLRRSRRTLVIASRRSRLAKCQAEQVGQSLACQHPRLAIEYRWIDSQGDESAEGPLAGTVSMHRGGLKGLFSGAIERAVLKQRADVAVHSLKDLPTELTPGLIIAAVPCRQDVRDCLIASQADTLARLPQGAVVGTSGPRRAAQVKRYRPDIRIKLIRGNVETRLRKVLESATESDTFYNATLLAMAGLNRCGLREHATKPIDPDMLLPAAGQGALAIQCREDDHITLQQCLSLNDPLTAAAVHLERRVVASLHGDCYSPIAVLAEHLGNGAELRLRARVLSRDGAVMAHSDQTAAVGATEQLFHNVLADLHRQNCEQILQM